jgi:DegV family protein with EDD domain
VPHELVIGDRTYRDGIDIQASEFYRLLGSGRDSITTVAPSPRGFSEAYSEAGQIAPKALCLTLSAKFSSTYRAAVAAVDSSGAVEVTVVDTGAAAGSLGLIALAAARGGAAGRSLDSVLAEVSDLAARVGLVAFLDTLKYLRRGGRINLLQGWAGSMLGIKPVTEFSMGEARVLGRPRNRAKAVRRLLDVMRERAAGEPLVVNILEAGAVEEAMALRDTVAREFDCRELLVSEFTPVMGAHTGPGLLGLAFHTDYNSRVSGLDD